MIYPLLNILTAFVLRGEGLMKLYLGYIFILLFVIATINSNRSLYIKNTICVVLAVLIIEWFLFIVTVGSSYNIQQLFMFSIFVVACFIFSDHEILDEFHEWMKYNTKVIIYIQFAYLAVLLCSCAFGDGINKGQWDIVSLKGPYEINHALAYELFLFVLIDAILLEYKFIFWILLCINSALIFLTAVRTVLLVWAIAAFFFFYKRKMKQKILMFICGIFVLCFLLFGTNILDAVIQKTSRAMETSTITSGRGAIYQNSIEAYLNDESPMHWISGMGQEKLGLYNRTHKIWMEIHAHNDFIDALAQFGIIGFCLCIASYLKLLKSKKWMGVILIFLMAFFNGFYMNPSSVLWIVVYLLFGKCMSKGKKENEKNCYN